MPREILSRKEFAIREKAKIVFDDAKTEVKIKKNGTVVIKLSGKIENLTDDLQVSTKDNDPITLDGRCGIFNMDNEETFKEGSVKKMTLSLQSNPSSTDKIIVLKSAGLDIVTTTTGLEGKGNHGSPFALTSSTRKSKIKTKTKAKAKK